MMLNVYAIRDLRSGFFGLNTEQNDYIAARNFANAIMESKGVLFTHASDFQLFRIGEFDSDNGVLKPAQLHELVSDGAEVLRSMRREDADV